MIHRKTQEYGIDRHYLYFESPSEYVNHVQMAIDSGETEKFKVFKQISKKYKQSRSDFWGEDYLEESIEKIRLGFPRDIEAFVGEEEFLNPAIKDNSFKISEEGFSYDMGSFVSGDPECCIEAFQDKPKKEINLTFSTSAPGYVSSQKLRMRAYSVLKMYQYLVDNGYIVNLRWINYSDVHPYTGDRTDKLIFTVVDIPVTYDLLSIMSAICTVGWFRGIGFMYSPLVSGYHDEDGSFTSDRTHRFKPLAHCLSEINVEHKQVFHMNDFYQDSELSSLSTQEEFDDYFKNEFRNFKKKHGEDYEEKEDEES